MNAIERETQKGMHALSDKVGKEQLIADFKVVVADTEALLKATADQGGEKLHEIRVRTEESLKIAQDRLMQAQEALIAKTRAAAKATDIYVHENPWKAIAAAAGTGLVIGLLISRH
ncbi:MAG: DUF883 family protein [Sulfuriferula sp.]|nr:DUF883 family protein [Sulfuriferula sp.]